MLMDSQPHNEAAFEALPRRIFLDSSTLQALQDYGEFVYDNVEPGPADRIYRVPGGYEELEALRAICFVGQRALFEFALSDHSFEEVTAKGDRSYLQWAYEMLGYWEGCHAAYDGSPFKGTGEALAIRLGDPSFGYLGEKDRLLLRDTLLLECDAFLTMDRKLARNAQHLKREVGLLVLLPTEYWELLRPWAALYT